MLELESKEIVDEACRLIGVHPTTKMVDTTPVRAMDVLYGRALSAMRYMKPYQVKFRRLTNLTLTLFKYHTLIPIQRFDKVIETLFNTYLTPKEANPILLKMSQNRYQQLLKQAEELANTYLRRPWLTWSRI